MFKALHRLITHWLDHLIPDPITPAWGFGYAALPLY